MGATARAAKIAVVGEYLKGAFPGDTVADTWDMSRSAHFYRVERGSQVAHRVLASQEFLDDHAPGEITPLLDRFRPAERIREAGTRVVVITNAGVRIEG